MNLQGQRREEPDVNLTSLIDVVLLLLVFFMVSTSFVKEAVLKVDLPEASEQAAVNQAEDSLVITVAANGELRVNDRELVNNRPDTLRAAIALTVGDERDIQVLLRADGKASHQSVVTAMDVLGRMGFSRLSIATVANSEDSR
ncbi:MAG: biopolymer transporter ExbD [Gammaproteobacteria bacterium]|nr:biopolymer transporter ExbD [Gammaproteobacteria bacterium]